VPSFAIEPWWSEATGHRELSVTAHTIRNICARYLEEGLEAAINEKPRPGAPTIFDGKAKAKITALACSEAPGGRGRWTLRLLADKAVELDLVEAISHTDVARILKKMRSSRTWNVNGVLGKWILSLFGIWRTFWIFMSEGTMGVDLWSALMKDPVSWLGMFWFHYQLNPENRCDRIIITKERAHA
jgi:transposase